MRNSEGRRTYLINSRTVCFSYFFLFITIFMFIMPSPASAEALDPCPSEYLPEHDKNDPPDLLIGKTCRVRAGGKYFYGNVNIIAGGLLLFEDPPNTTPTDFWARSIIVENGGSLVGGLVGHPYGNDGAVLTIHLYGPDQSRGDPARNPGMGAPCRTPETDTTGPCGIPISAWLNNGKDELSLPGDVKDYFYRYGPLRGDEKCSNGETWRSDKPHRCDEEPKLRTKVGYFGYKVLAVSYGGGIVLHGRVGGCPDWRNCASTWGRLAKSIAAGDGIAKGREFEIEGPYLSKGDQIIVTTTDYLPGHSETFDVEAVTRDVSTGRETVRVKQAAQWPHNGTRYSLVDRLKAAASRLSTIDPKLTSEGAETRAAVAITNSSVRIVSAGDNPGDDFPDSPGKNGAKCQLNPDGRTNGEGPCYSFGGHMVIRQGFRHVFVSGVEFKQMGQGGRLGHYPIHFHMARKVPHETYITGNVINESMTRWIVLHSTLGVIISNNVGYKSIGHGFYLEDATETDNMFVDNLGIFARAAIDNDQNPRKIAGILSDNGAASAGFPYRSDSEYPSVFWITNGWNFFHGNMAAGAGMCGTCYWLVPAANSSMADVPDKDERPQDMKWTGYAALQKNQAFAGTTPLKSFGQNFCTSAMMSFQTTADAPACLGALAASDSKQPSKVRDLKSLAPPPDPDKFKDMYYPHIFGVRAPTLCNADPRHPGEFGCSNVTKCSQGNLKACEVVVLDHYTSSFNWAEGTVSAIWLRQFWYLVDNSVLTDVQNAALTFITGGDFTHSSVIPGYWALVRNSIFVGHTQDQKNGNPYAADLGPFNTRSRLKCDPLVPGNGPPNWCLSTAEGVSIPVTGWFTNQRMFSIYDGPGYEDTNAYLDITTTKCSTGFNSGCMYGVQSALGVPKVPGTGDPKKLGSGDCYLPNAAIAWKQPNGFFYPPAFHSANLFFDNVDIRHYVIDPLFQENTYKTKFELDPTDPETAENLYCFPNTDMFDGFTAIDRQTELNDDDGSLTGLSNNMSGSRKQTISVNEDAFFNAPLETAECGSNPGFNNDPKNACQPRKATEPPVTAKTSPFDYVSTVIYHPQQVDAHGQQIWSTDCANQRCYGVPLFRQYLTEHSRINEWENWSKKNCNKNSDTAGCRWPFIRMAGAAIATRQTLTVDGEAYYLDTTVSRKMQDEEKFNHQGVTGSFNVFEPGQTYTVFFLYLKPETHQTYQIYVGEDFAADALKAVQVEIPGSLKVDPLAHMPDWLQVDRSAVKTTGILTVKTSFESASTLLEPTPANGLCQPREFCKAVGDKCVGNVSENDPRFWVGRGVGTYGPEEADAICGRWAVKDLDCPLKGCLGFQFTLPDSFVADAELDKPSPHRPQPQPFPASPTIFTRTTSGVPDNAPGGTCYYPHVPGQCGN
jgi:hypothetical protein